MPFQKGHKLAKGGNHGGGRPTKAQVAEKQSFLKALERERERLGAKLAERYFEMALSDPATMRHAVDRIEPPAKQQIEHSGIIVHEIKSSIDWDKA